MLDLAPIMSGDNVGKGGFLAVELADHSVYEWQWITMIAGG